jgi:hypothetical protein
LEDARELEQATSLWPPEKFASLCDALVWVASGRRCPGFPSFTMRVNAADDGIDAEWEVEISEGSGGLPTPIVGPGWNIPFRTFGKVAVDSFEDIAVNKIRAILGRDPSEPKDFVDLYFILRRSAFTLEYLLERAKKKEAALDREDG